MKTRSQTNYENTSIYKVDIDFDEASELWKANKKSIGNGSYKYVCSVLTKKGNKCNRQCLPGLEFCRYHKK
uniref:Uncharacterized protein n=1 Tax=viral metagenome TaxID=1070528 RepID=A0A6C0EPV9_9ZZZZ